MPAPTSEPSSGPSDLRSFAFELRDNLVTMPVVVNGHTITGVLDSGSGSTLVDRGVSREIGLFEEGEAGEALGGGTEAQALSNVTIDDFLFGPVRLTHVSGYAFDLGHLTSSASFPVELVVGAPVLEKRRGSNRLWRAADHVRRQRGARCLRISDCLRTHPRRASRENPT
jgi:hypothetical protein